MQADSPQGQLEQNAARNVEAIRHVDPELASVLAELALPDHVKLATGRDGSITFRVTGPDGADTWFGRTSMPTVSAPALLANFNAAEANVALPGIGCGLEAKLLCQRLGPHQAVFVLESDPVKLKLALHLHDLSQPLRSRRLILMLGPDHHGQLLQFCHEHEGFEPPTRMLSWPWLEPQECQNAAEALARVGKAVSAQRNETLAKLREAGAGCAGRSPLPERPRVAVLAISPRGIISRFGYDLHQAAIRAGWASTAVLMDTPANGSLIPHCRAAVEFQADVFILLDHVRPVLPALPERVPAVTWLSPAAAPDHDLARALGPRDRCVAMTSKVCRELRHVGLREDRMLILPPAANLDRYQDPAPGVGACRPPSCDVVMIAEAANVDPEACGLKMTSHQVLWKALAEVIRQNADRYHDSMLPELFAQAERRTSVHLTDESVRGELLDRARLVLGPTLQRLGMVEALLRAGRSVGLWGPGWDWCETLKEVWHGSVLSDYQRLQIYRGGKLALYVDPGGRAGQELFDALACGAVVLVKSCPPYEAVDNPAALFDMKSELVGFADRRHLVALAAGLLNDAKAREEIAARARQRLAAQHLYVHRLQALRNHLRSQSAP